MSASAKGAKHEREVEHVYQACLGHADAVATAGAEHYMGGSAEALGIELKRIALELDTLSVRLRGGKR